jgi:hypothetical protein
MAATIAIRPAAAAAAPVELLTQLPFPSSTHENHSNLSERNSRLTRMISTMAFPRLRSPSNTIQPSFMHGGPVGPVLKKSISPEPGLHEWGRSHVARRPLEN